MLNSKQKKWAIITILFIANLLLGLFGNIKIAYGQEYEVSISLPQNFVLNEFSENMGTIENKNTINLDFGSSRWNVNSLDFNFTDITLERELKTIEDNATNFLYLDKFHHKLAVQINITESTDIYAAYIYADVSTPSPGNVWFQINGYDSVNNKPNDTIYGSPIELNISSADWHTQKFPSPIKLSPGYYCLVIDASSIGNDPASYYRWFLNDETPKNLDLNTWDSNRDSWEVGENGKPLLYKLYQKTNKTFYPEVIDMTIEVNSENYEILNGTEKGTGKFMKKNLDFSLSNVILHVPIKNNASLISREALLLNFTLNYRINLKNSFYTNGLVKIDPSSNIEWNVDFNLNRSDGNYSVKFVAPHNWENFSIFKDWNNITSDNNITTIGNIISINNNTIPYENILWKITANSPKIGFSLIIQKPAYNAGEELTIGVKNPMNGTYTFVLYSLGGFEEYREVKNFPPETQIQFSYNLTSSAVSGNWTGYIYWNNETDAGFQSQEFKISGTSPLIPVSGGGGGGSNGTTTLTGLDPLLVFIVATIGIAGTVGGLATYKKLQNIKRQRDLELIKLHTQFIDILSLNYLLVVDKKTGLNVYEQFFSGKEIDASLISGFFEAIRNFGIELTGTSQQSQTVKLEYQKLKILMSEFRDFRIILIMAENPSDDFLTKITQLSYDIDQNFGHLLQDFKGITTEFKGLKLLIEKNLNTSLIAPLKVIEVSDLDLKPSETALINEAKSIMEQKNLDYFYTRSLLPEQSYDPKKTRTIFNLIEKKIFIPAKLP